MDGLWKTLGLNLLILALVGGCSTEEISPDGEFDEGIIAGKADGSSFSECELEQVRLWLNEATTTLQDLLDAGVHSRASRNLIEHRDSIDENHTFDSIEEVDDVYYVGPVAMRQLVAAVEDRCQGRADQAQVFFSPQEYGDSHLTEIAEAIGGANLSLDIAIYSFRDSNIEAAIEAAIARGVQVRMLFESAHEDRRDPEGTTSARLEEMGVDVRWINQIMHHKYVIIDGPQTTAEEARDAVLITGSANWSHSAATRYDENTVILRGNTEAILRFQREFNHLWANSRPLDWNEELEYFETLEIQDAMILNDPAIDMLFTSDNFRAYEHSRYGRTFSYNAGMNTVSDRLVELIWSAQESIHVASGHLRSRPVAEALIARHEADPDLDIRVYLDNQEYLSEWSHNDQQAELAECLAEAEDEDDRLDCLDSGFLFSYALHEAGIPVRFKFYCYRWHYSYAPQMHHKYIVFDGNILASGSYNLSANAEQNTMENVVIYDASAFPMLVDAFDETFETLWVTAEEDGLYGGLLDDIVNGTDDIPLVFDAMALNWDQVTELKSAIRDACPEINSEDFRRNPERHWYCDR